jgi:hypothetical protein
VSHLRPREGNAGDWAQVSQLDAEAATHHWVWRDGCTILGVAPDPATFRTSFEIEDVLKVWDENDNGYDKPLIMSLDTAMHDIAKFVRALALHEGIIEDADFREGGSNTAARLITGVIEGDFTFPRRLITNTEPSYAIGPDGGNHWFNVAFSADFQLGV